MESGELHEKLDYDGIHWLSLAPGNDVIAKLMQDLWPEKHEITRTQRGASVRNDQFGAALHDQSDFALEMAVQLAAKIHPSHTFAGHDIS